MKKSSLILVVIFLISMTSFQSINAQDKTKADKEKEMRMQETIDAQKKAMAEQQKAQQKAQQELDKSFEDQQIVIEKAMKDAKIKIDEADIKDKVMRVYENSRGDRPFFNNGEPFVFSPGIEYYGHAFGDGDRTSWDFSKSIKETSFSRDYTFDVESTVKTVVMSVNGDCKTGEIKIKIVMPNGKTYSDIIIDESGNLNWRKSFTISDTENKDKAGAWKYEISASKATGYFKISLQTY
jgi:hypothetical protein